jgi:hypothetical protein
MGPKPVAIIARLAYRPILYMGTPAMILGLSLSAFTILHVFISLIGIVSGVVVVYSLLRSTDRSFWTWLFLGTTMLTSLTGFLFPFERLLPSHIFGVVSIVVLALALFALYGRRLTGPWRWIYVSSVLLALYFNMFVGVVQSFQKLAFLQALAPTQSEPPFVIAQIGLLAAFVVVTYFARARSYRPAATHTG